MKKVISLASVIVCLALIVVMFTACGDKNNDTPSTIPDASVSDDVTANADNGETGNTVENGGETANIQIGESVTGENTSVNKPVVNNGGTSINNGGSSVNNGGSSVNNGGSSTNNGGVTENTKPTYPNTNNGSSNNGATTESVKPTNPNTNNDSSNNNSQTEAVKPTNPSNNITVTEATTGGVTVTQGVSTTLPETQAPETTKPTTKPQTTAPAVSQPASQGGSIVLATGDIDDGWF